MMAAEENWQTKLSTIVEKTAFIFNNELLSDVKFVVSLPNGGGESKKAIPAHKSDNVTRSVPVDVKPSLSLLGQLMLDQSSRMTRYTHLNPLTNSDG